MKLVKVFVFLIISGIFLESAAFSAPLLGELKGDDGTILWSGYTQGDTGVERVVLTDTDGVDDSSVATLYIAMGSYYTNDYLSFGIYDYIANTDGTITKVNEKMLGDTASGFSTGYAQKLTFNVNTNEASLDQGATWFDMNHTFGFYLRNSNTGETFYTHTSLNNDGFDHALIYDTRSITSGPAALVNSDVIVAFEDLLNGGDKDYNDFIFGVTDVAPVPEPATMFLFGMGLVGLVGSRRMKI